MVEMTVSQEDEILEHIAGVEQFQVVADLFDQLSDTTRLKIFWILCHREKCVLEISKMMEMSSAAISHHLRQLKAFNLIEARRIGKEVYYKATDIPEAQFLHKTIEQLMHIACPGLDEYE